MRRRASARLLKKIAVSPPPSSCAHAALSRVRHVSRSFARNVSLSFVRHVSRYLVRHDHEDYEDHQDHEDYKDYGEFTGLGGLGGGDLDGERKVLDRVLQLPHLQVRQPCPPARKV